MADTKILAEYDNLLVRFNNAFSHTWEEGSKADIAFTDIIHRLAEIEKIIKEG